MSESAAERRVRRAAWPVRRYRLGEEPSEDLTQGTSAEERLAMVWRLTLDAWASAGLSLPEYSRSEMPGRVLRPSDDPADVE